MSGGEEDFAALPESMQEARPGSVTLHLHHE